MVRERTLLLPADGDAKITELYNQYREVHLGDFQSRHDFLVYLVALGADQAEAALNRYRAPSIVLPR